MIAASTRGFVVLALLAVIAAGVWAYRRWQARHHQGPVAHPRLPETLLDGADRTWVLFTTPYCATCGPVEASLRASDPHARVVKVDATREPALAGQFAVRRAPTVLLADRTGEVQARLVGAEAVATHLAAGAAR